MGDEARVSVGRRNSVSYGRAVVTFKRDGLMIEAPGPRDDSWPKAVTFYGAPWFIAVLVGSVWYLGWGVPDEFWVRCLLWVVVLAMTSKLHTLALISAWDALYMRTGTETLVINPEFISVKRRAGDVPRNFRIRRKIIERVEMLPDQEGKAWLPKMEIKSWRSAIRFGAGLNREEAEQCARVINELFAVEEALRHALTPVPSEDTIATMQPVGLAGGSAAKKGKSRIVNGLRERAETVKVRVARRSRKSPPSLDPKGTEAE
ncbi:MAG: hypothetical protein JXA36_04495 [Coriobacteriia bacterium]|nr:hypothetical protein [Coriobacteriia bacterium]